MSHEHHTSYQEVIERSSIGRLDRLNTFVELEAPPSIVCLAIWMLFKAAILLYGAELWKAVQAGLVEDFRNDMGFCATCEHSHSTDRLCPTCAARQDAEVAALEGEGGPL